MCSPSSTSKAHASVQQLVTARKLGLELDARTGSLTPHHPNHRETDAGHPPGARLDRRCGAIRMLQLAESGSGKTLLLHNAVLAILDRRWQVFFIDAKGNPEDADKLAAIARARGHSVQTGAPGNLFTGTAA